MSRSSALRRPPAPLPSVAPAGESGTAVDRERRRGRGAHSNSSGRYEPLARISFDDGWQAIDDLPPFKTTVTVDATRKIITRNDSPDLSFDRSINPYRGCEHGCVYCFARPTHAYLGLSPGLDFESKLFMKPNAPELLERELSAPGYVPKTIAIGTNTDPYQPIERRHQIMRRILEVLERAGHPVGIVTKSALVLRDLDILARMARAQSGEGGDLGDDARCQARAHDGAARLDAAATARRAAATGQGRRAGFRSGRAGHPRDQRRGDRAHPRCAWQRPACATPATCCCDCRSRCATCSANGCMANFPDRYRHVFKLIRDMRGGKDYDFDLRHAHDRHRPHRLDDRPPLRGRLRAARLQYDNGEDHHGTLPAATSGR